MLTKGAISSQSNGECSKPFGLGWFVTPTVFGHRGGRHEYGYHSYFFAFHGQEMGDLQLTSMAVMTNASEGLQVIRGLVNAVMYLKGWPRQKFMPSNLGIDASLPWAAPLMMPADSSWKDWRGTWSRGSQRGCKLL